MKNFIGKVTVTVALFLGMIRAQEAERDLQALPSRVTVTKELRYYGDDYNVPFASTLGCGVCINSGYIYCIQGAEGDDYTGKTLSSTNSVCCPAGATAA